MMRRLLIGIALLLVLLVAVAAGGLYWFFSGDGIRRALEQQSSTWLGQPVQIGSARAQFFPRVGVAMRDVRVGQPTALTLARVDLSTDLRALIDRRIEEADLLVADSRVQMPLPFSIPSNEAAPSADAPPADAQRAITLVSVRSIALQDVAISSRGRDILLNAQSSLAGDTLQLTGLTATSGSTALEASGTVALAPRVDAQLEVKANRLDVDELLALADAFSPPATSASPQTENRGRANNAATRIKAHVTSERARAGGVDVTQFAADVTAEGDRVSLSPVSFQLFDGRYEGSLTATLGRALSLSLQSRLTNLDVAQLAAFGGAADTVTGRLSGNGSFSGRGTDVAAVLESLRGDGSAAIVDGSIARLNMIRTVVLFFGRPAPDAAAGSDRFERLDARFSVSDGVVRAESLSLQSPDVDLVGDGTLTVANKALSGRFNLMLSEALSAQAGTDLYRYTREGNRVVLPANVGGTLAAPRLTIDAAAAVKRGLRNEVERRLKGLFDKFQ